ncbi:formate dehydrogenase subunit gamma [Dechloromonas sp. TW-R-39-2]|uniref:formate dehydrogenase subunit gamma n=1 Tax=Dechloromonas sp. TW-R-39-2 TaxID=2654218 RepID=UPI00193C8B8E|nr:formate dehydrogenase subunit gamma [Dechloromonas sp. TW-R-39-2]QRM17948.1 formate dehydrogenase subunit gamma [Dechloromonas sp. TW-R-39-2]
MTTSNFASLLGRWLIAACLMLAWGLPLHAADAPPAQQQAERQQTQPGNNAPMWREVRQDKEHFTTNRGIEAGVLIQDGGNAWRHLRNGPLTTYGGWLLVLVVAAILAFYKIKGPLTNHDPLTGKLIQRFPRYERVVHWLTAGTFLVLAATGLAILFGKHVLIPIIGHSLFGYLMVLGKNAHNFIGPLFAFSTLAMIAVWARDNVWQNIDALWIRKAGGLLTGEHVPSGRFNFGEKTWFWIGVTILGLTVSVTGFILDFPNFGQLRADMQLASLVHAVAAITMLLLAFGHIYMGTIGVDGALNSMQTGYVDETWAREHHEEWFNDVKAGKSGHPKG